MKVFQRPVTSVDVPGAHYSGLHPSTAVLPKGHRKSPEHRPFATSTVYEKDIEIKLRDSVTLRADVFRPSEVNVKVPALLAWGPYGKSGSGQFSLNMIQGRVGIPQKMLSGYENFEGLDPADWTSRGYAIVNVDARGSFDSEGDVLWFGSAEGRDGYDAVEEISKQPWCNGSIALMGNSWLAMAQWFIAAEKPPHLKAIAPFEGCSDFYRETLCRGGVPYKPFWSFLAQHAIFGHNKQEDVIGMIEKYPLMNEYWEDKRAKIEQIEVPAYVVASYASGLHVEGAFRGFQDLPRDKKWLRIHASQEWHDLYQPSTNDDLQLFFDRYTLDVQNGWERTPRVRVSVLPFNKSPELNHTFPDWPIPNTHHQTLYLTKDEQLIDFEPNKSDSGTFTYQAAAPALQMGTDAEELSFIHTFSRRQYLIGPSKAVLYMSCATHNDMDVFVILRKADQNGTVLQNLNIPLDELGMAASDLETNNCLKYLGASGILRASHRALDDRLSQPHWPMHAHNFEDKILPGKIVKLEIPLWPTGMLFEAGEKIVLRIAGHPMTLAELPALRGKFETNNQGRHMLHVGSEYTSHLILPLVQM